MTDIDVKFNVTVDLSQFNYIDLNYMNVSVCLVGNIPELGCWNPNLCTFLSKCFHQENSAEDTWSACVTVSSSQNEIEYRYFIAEFPEGIANFTKVLNWESFLKPRVLKLSELPIVSSVKCVPLSHYGYNGDKLCLQRGWLTGQTEIHVRLYGSQPIKWLKQRHQNRRIFICCKSHTLHLGGEDSAGSDSDNDDSGYPSRRWSKDYSTSNINYSQLALCYFLRQDACEQRLPSKLRSVSHVNSKFNGQFQFQRHDYGVEFRPGIDSLTFVLQTTDLENTAVELELWLESSRSSARLSDSVEHGVTDIESSDELNGDPRPFCRLIGTARLGPFDELTDINRLHIVDGLKRTLGSLKVDHMVITPTQGIPCSMAATYMSHWKRRQALHIGHRGTGSSYNAELSQQERAKENTLQAFKNATHHGADYVELDVHLSKDLKVIVYHDFTVAIALRKKTRELKYFEIPVKDLKFEELQALKLSHTSVLTDNEAIDKIDQDDLDPIELQPFVLLSSCLQHSDSHLGFNIEVKYPINLKNGESEQSNYFESNLFVDTLLSEIFAYAGSRRIIFSCFSPDICVMLQMKQNKYPVLLLTQSDWYGDHRHDSLYQALYFSLSNNFRGLSCDAEEILNEPQIVQAAQSRGLTVFTWGAKANDKTVRDTLTGLGIDAIIYDEIQKERTAGTPNVFQIEDALKNSHSSLISQFTTLSSSDCDANALYQYTEDESLSSSVQSP